MNKLLPLVLAAACGAAFAADNGKLDKKDLDFLNKAAAGGMMEVEAGKLAQSKGASADVKEFGSMLQADHTAANDELNTIAQKKGVRLPMTLPKKDQKELDKLANAKDFDRKFIHEGVEDHKHDIKEFEKESKNGKDPDVKAFAAKTLPVLQKHLERAQQIDKELKGKKG